MNRSLAAGAAASLALMGWLATSAAAHKGTRQAVATTVTAPVTVSPRRATAGSTATVAGRGCSGSRARVVVDFGTDVEGDFTPVGTPARFTPRTDGGWSGTVVLPDGLVPGPNYAIEATCDHGTEDLAYRRAAFEVRPFKAPRPAAPVLAQPDLTG